MNAAKVSYDLRADFLPSSDSDCSGTLHITLYRVSRCLCRCQDEHDLLIRECPISPPMKIGADIPARSPNLKKFLGDHVLSHANLSRRTRDNLASKIASLAARLRSHRRAFLITAEVEIAKESFMDEARGRGEVCADESDGLMKRREDDDLVCAICLEELSGARESIEMLCTHFFHKECLFTWLKENRTCPLCRRSAGD